MRTVDDSRVEPLGVSRAVDRVLRGFRFLLRAEPASRPLLTPEQFQDELAVLRLCGRPFGPEEYLRALEAYLGISIRVHVLPDALYPELLRRLATSGQIGELRYSEELKLAAIFVPGSLPPVVLTLTILHELGHLAAGDLLVEPDGDGDRVSRPQTGEVAFATSRLRPGRRLARAHPFADEALREHEANLRASYALVAGCLGDESPLAYERNDVL